MKKIVIVGNGVAGVTAARFIRKYSDNQITIIGSETEHFYSRTALMYIFMGHMKFDHTKPYEDWFWKKNKIDLLFDYVDEIDFESRSLQLQSGNALSYDQLVVATGSKTALFNWKGQNLPGVCSLYSIQDLERIEIASKNCKKAIIVGGGLIGVELAEMLHSRGIEVTMLIREDGYWRNVLPKEEAALIERHLQEHGIDVKVETELTEIVGKEKVEGVITSAGEQLECQLVGLTAGVSPNIELVSGTLETNRGILVDEYLQTSIPDVYAIGDCCELRNPPKGRRAIEPVWYVGRIMGETVGKTLAGKRTTYQPGNWYNSAKFFDIEYQTYGLVSADRQQGEGDFFWEDETGKICLHIVFEKDSQKLIGINAFGLRMRHEVVDSWLIHACTTHQVVEELHKAVFDPEFSKDLVPLITREYLEQFPNSVQLQPKKNFLQTIFQR